jgi:hypothetical protein
MKLRVLSLLLLGVVCIAVSTYSIDKALASAGGHTVSERANSAVGPAKWIPFVADFKGQCRGNDCVTGVTYRDANGSMRYERSNATVSVVTINNRVNRTIYVRQPQGEWTQAAMPSNMPNRPPIVSLAGLRGLSSTVESVGSFAVLRYARDDSVQFLAPALNFFAVRKETVDGIEEHTNIRIENPSADLFLPPVGVGLRSVSDISDLTRRAR